MDFEVSRRPEKKGAIKKKPGRLSKNEQGREREEVGAHVVETKDR